MIIGRGLSILAVAAACYGLGLNSASAETSAAAELSASHTQLETIAATPGPDGTVDVTVMVEAPQADILSTHVILKPHSTSQRLQRTASGYYTPWDGSRDTLGDAGFRAENGTVTFKVLNESLSGIATPLTVVLMIGTASGDLSGEFQVEAAQ